MNPDPSTKSANQATIPVPLQQALSSLDVSLETELARYRRLRPRSPRPRPQVEAQRLQPLELFEAGRTPTPAPTEATPTPAQTAPPLELTDVKETPAVSSLVHQPTPQDTEVEKPPTPAPQEYLQSSEELLRSLKTDSPKEKKATKSLFTPLGIGSILVLLVSSALLGSAFVDAEGFSRLRLDQWKLGSSDSPTSEEEDTTAVAPINTPTPETAIPQSPNLSRQEFIDLDLGSLSTLPVDEENAEGMTPAPTPAQTTQPQSTPATPAAPTAGSNLTTALLPPALRPQLATPEEAETSASETASEDVEAAPAPTNSNFYFVMVDYTGANSLAKAQEIVSDAYLVELPEGVHIQMGASPQESSAQALVEELQDQGFVASVYRP